MKKEIYKKIKSSVYKACEDVGIKPRKIGKLSNGDDRLLISFKNKKRRKLLIVAGQDEDELPPILAMRDIIKEIPKYDLKFGVNIVPYFDISPSFEEIVGKELDFSDYEGLKKVLEDYTIYSGEDIKRKIMNKVVKGNSEKENYLKLAQEINELLITKQGLLVINNPKLWGYGMLNAICYGLDEDLPYKMYCLNDFDEKSIKILYKEPFSFEYGVFYSRPLYAFFDLSDDKLPKGLKQMKNIVRNSNWLLNFHSDKGEPFILNVNAPRGLTEKIISALKADNLNVRSAEDLSKTIIGDLPKREGVVEVASVSHKSKLEGHVKEFSIVFETEDDLEKGKLESMIALKEVLKYLNKN